MRRSTGWLWLLVILSGMIGCTTSTAPPAGGTPTKPGTGTTATETPGEVKSASVGNGPEVAGDEKYPDVPVIPIMTEVDGIKVPRLKETKQSLVMGEPIPADVGNTFVTQQPSGEPVTGDRIVIRFNSEPKTMNAITETSAVETYISSYVRDALAEQNPETFEFEPHIAESWVAEDSVKLSADYPGKERRVTVVPPGDSSGGQPAVTTYELTAVADKDEKNPAKWQITTTDKAGQPVPKCWVGLFPVGKVLGAPTNGFHYWSDEKGKLTISGLPVGKYELKVGAEIFGKLKSDELGGMRVTPISTGNPLADELASAKQTDLHLKPGEWSDIQHQTYYTFTLNPKAKWSDGTPFTTRDLEFAYSVINNPTVDGDSLRVYYQDIVECTPLSPLVIRLRYRQQYFKAFEFTAGLAAYTPPFHFFQKLVKEKLKADLTLERLTEAEEKSQGKLSAHNQEFGKFYNTDSTYNLQPLGTGPYTIVEWKRGDLLRLKRNPDYWRPGKGGYLDEIVVKFIPDNVTAMKALEAGEIDFFWLATPEQFFKELEGPPDWFKKQYVKGRWFTPGYKYVGWNQLRPMFQDRRVRVALSMLFNKQEFLAKKMHGAGILISGSEYLFGPAYDPSVLPIGFNPEAARDLLAEAGWIDTDGDGVLDRNKQKFEFEYLIPPGNPVYADLAAILQKNLKDVGIVMNIKLLEWASFIEKIKAKEFDVVSLRWSMNIENDPYQIWHSSGAAPGARSSNHVSFNNPQADQLIEMLRLTLNKEKRHKIQHALHHLLDYEQPYIFLELTEELGMYHQRFRGVKWYRLRPGFDLKEWYVPKALQRPAGS